MTRTQALAIASVCAAAAHLPLRPRTMRVLFGVLSLVATADGPVDATHRDVADAAGRIDTHKLREELRVITDAGLIDYRPGGPGAVSRFALPSPGAVGRVRDATPSHNGRPSPTVT